MHEIAGFRWLALSVLLSSATLAQSAAAENNEAPVVFGDDVPAELVAEIGNLDTSETRSAAEARSRIIAQGSEAAPAVLAALEDIVDAIATYDRANLGDKKSEYKILVNNLYHLLAVIGAIGDESHAARLDQIGRNLDPDNIVTASFYSALAQISSPDRSDEFAARVIADANSSSMQLLVAMSRFLLRTPPEVAASALQHIDDDTLKIRAIVYRLAINADRIDDVRLQLFADVDSLEYTRTGNKELLFAFALAEKPDAFDARLKPLRIRRTTLKSATTLNRFSWGTSDEKIELLKKMIGSDSFLAAEAIKHMLENDRVDLLEEYRLAGPPRPFRPYISVVPNIETMSREQRLQYFDEDILNELEEIEASNSVVVSSTTARVVEMLGYRLELEGDRVVIHPP